MFNPNSNAQTAAQVVSSVTNAAQYSIAVAAPMDDADADAKKLSPTGADDENDVMNKFGFNSTTELSFGQYADRNFAGVYLEMIRADIAEARKHLDELPETDRRGLTLETYRHFGCGYLPQWILTKSRAEFACGKYVNENTGEPKKLPPPSPRIIVPTASGEHFNGICVPSARSKTKREYWKQHAGSMELFFADRDAFNRSDIVIVVEGEFDAMSIWQASQGKIAAVAILGCMNWKKTLLPKIAEFKNKQLILLLDADAAGKDAAQKLTNALIGRGVRTVNRTLFDVLTISDQKNFGTKCDCNDILRQNRGNYFLNHYLEKIIADAQSDFDNWKSPADLNPFEGTEPNIPAPKPRSFTKETVNFTADNDIIRNEIRLILNDFVHSKNLSRSGWFQVGCIMKRYGFDFADFDQWSRADSRYNQADCLVQWNSIKTADALKNSGYKIGTLIELGKQFGYQPSKTYLAENKRIHEEKILATPIEEAKTREEAIDELKALSSLPQSADRDAKIRNLIRDLCEWKRDKQKRRTEIKATQANLDLIFQNDPDLDGLVGYDEFAMNYTFLRKSPWGYQNRGDQWTDADDAQIRTFLRRHYANLENRQIVFDNVVSYGQEHAFHEVKEFFRSLPKWDNVPRAETLFVKFLGADDTPYTREVTINWLTAAVARIFHAGCDYQLAPILLGAQGIGKSHICRKLFGKWYGSLVDDVADTHAIDTIQRLWGVEVKEMAAMKKDVDANKRFIDAACDVRRFAYARRATSVPRHCVFVITTNNQLMLADATGNRRYPVIHCHNKTFVEGLTDEFIQQLWSEVFAHYNELFKDGFDEQKLSLSTDAKKILEENNQQFMRDNDVKAEIVAFLDQKILPTVIWNLMSKPERRQFFQNGGSIAIEETDLITRFKIRKRISAALQAEFDEACRGEFVKRVDARDPRTGVFTTHFVFYGTEYRKHICAAEILNEAFEPTDKRKSPNKIHELLATIDGWTLGERIARDRHYGNQPKVYYRDATNIPTDDDDQPQPQIETQEPNQSTDTDFAPKTATPTDTSPAEDYLQGAPLTDRELDDCPFDLDQFE